MGAEFYDTIELGTSARAAFNAAHDEATYLYGHAGYTGTIAEKQGWKYVGKLPPRVTTERFLTWAQNYEEWKRNGRWTTWRGKPAIKAVKHRVNPLPAKWRGTHLEDMILMFNEVADDKWGPIACVEANEGERARTIKGMRGLKRGTKVYLFAGYCSS